MKLTLRYFIVGIIVLMICPVALIAQTPTDGSGVGDKQVKTNSVSNQPDQPSGENVEWVKNETKKYSPASWDVLMKYDKMPAEIEGKRKGWWTVTLKKPVGTFDELKGASDKKVMIDRMALNVRLVDLALQRHDLFRYARDQKMQMEFDNAEVLLNAASGKSYYLSFPKKSLFPSSQLTELIPQKRQTFYYNTYIKGDTVAQRFGVIGLLEEYYGYYVGSKYYMDMFEVYKIIEESDVNGFFEWARHSQSTLGAFYELDYLIREYLLYMKEHHPADYEALKSYQPFVEAYGDIRSAYEGLMNRYWTFIESEIKRLSDTGKILIGLDDGLLWIRSMNGKNVTGTNVLPDREKLVDLLNGDRYAAIMKDFPRK